MKRKPAQNGIALRGLSRGATYRFSPEIAKELEVHATVRSLRGSSPGTQRGIVEEALLLWFKNNPISVRQRDAAEYLLDPKS